MPRVVQPEEKHGGRFPIREETFIVERILGDKKENGTQKYLVKWGGYSDDHNTWEPLSCLENCEDKIQKWLDRASEQLNQHSQKKELEKANIQQSSEKPKRVSILKRESKYAQGVIQNPNKINDRYAMKIVGLKEQDNKLLYLIQWHGKQQYETTWESEDTIPNYLEVLKFWVEDDGAKNYDIHLKAQLPKKSSLKQKSQRQSIIPFQLEVNDPDELEEYGNYTYYDVPERIIAGRMIINYFNQREVLIRWMPRENGIRPKDSWMQYEQTRIRAQYAVLDYFEKYAQSRVLFEETVEVIKNEEMDDDL